MARTPHEKSRNETDSFSPIDRPRLVGRLSASATRPITLIIAAAGYGKSVILRQYFETLHDRAVRFAVRPEHASLLGFLRGLTQALGEPAPHAMTALAGAFERNTTPTSRSAELARWLKAHLESFVGMLAIDDLHLADGDPEVAHFVTSLVEHTKDQIRWILSSRSGSGLPIATWLTYGDADLPIDERALRFTFAEVREAADRLRLSIGDDELHALLTLTEGWPAAMSFALRSSMRSGELRNVAALTREMIYGLLAEQIYAALDERERNLMAVAVALPVIDVRVLERAGFDQALPILERLRERSSFIYEESPGVYQCHDLFRDFLRHQAALGGKRSQQSVHERAARALEETEDFEHAIVSYVAAGSPASIVRLLEAHGFDLLERARGDIVARAVEALDERTRRENAFVLGLQGALLGTVGRFSRAESFLRRALARAGKDRDLFATVSVRLASLMANQGQDVSELLSAVGCDPKQSPARRVEALSLIAGQRAVAQDVDSARRALKDARALIHKVDSDSVRAKALHHIGIALHHLRDAKEAFEALTQSCDLAAELHLFSIVSRANAVLSNLALHEEDDVALQLQYAEVAAAAARKGGDAFALQTALLQVLGALMRSGDSQRSVEAEQQLASVMRSELVTRYLAFFRSLRLAWEGRFDEAHHLIASCWAHLPHDFDRVVCGAEYALFLAIDGERDRSTTLIREVACCISSSSTTGVFRQRSVAIATTFCALADAINGRAAKADHVLRSVRIGGDPVVARVTEIAYVLMERLRNRTSGASDSVRDAVTSLKRLGHGDVAQLLKAVERELLQKKPQALNAASLTATELEVLRMLAAGLIPKEIASRKERSVHTVRVHIANVMAKLGCHGRSEAIKVAQQMGLI
jgi:ATP/maltotriose-dependent transcriptional regulator MalT